MDKWIKQRKFEAAVIVCSFTLTGLVPVTAKPTTTTTTYFHFLYNINYFKNLTTQYQLFNKKI